MAASPSIALAYGFLGSNLGDVAITKGALALLRAAGARGQVKVISRGLNTRLTRGSWNRVVASDPDIVFHAWDHTFAPFRSESPPGIDFIEALLDSPHVRAEILKAAGLQGIERLYYSGGENLFSYGTAHDEWNLFGRLSVILAAQAEGVRTGFLPCTFGPFESEVSRHLIARAVEGADFVLARDLRSLGQLPPAAQASPGADCAFFTPDAVSTATPPSRWGKRIAMVPRIEGTGLRLGPDRSQAYMAGLGEKGIEQSGAFQLYLDIGRRILSAGRYIRLLTQCDADVELNRALFNALKPLAKLENQVSLTRPGSLMGYHRILASCGGVVTSRLHTAIFALQNGVVPIALYYDAHGHKTPGVFEVFGLGEFCMPAQDFTLDMLMPLIARARSRAAEARVTIDAVRTQTIQTVSRYGGLAD